MYMNKIIIDNNKFISNNTLTSDNTILFKKSGKYNIEINNSNKLDLEFRLEDNVDIKLYVFLTCNNITGSINYYFGNNSSLTLYKFSNDSLVDLEEDVYLDGINSVINYNFSNICNNISDYKIKVFHNNNYTKSYISNKFVGNNGSKINIIIDSILEQGNIGCIMDQTSKIMCIGDVDARVCPNMYIDEDDVEAKHGSVIGKFNDDDIFYLISRGISYEESLKLLIKGFIISNLNVDDKRIKKIYDIVDDNYR